MLSCPHYVGCAGATGILGSGGEEIMVRTLLKPMLPVVRAWMDKILATHIPKAQRLDEFKFSRLPQYFSRELYSSVKVVIADPLPMPPFSTMALAVFRQKSNFGGI